MRKSNVELMRTILFAMVVSIHVTAPYLSSHTISGVPNWQFANLLDGGSRCAVDCFVLLTGYFLSLSNDVKPGRLIRKVISPIAFYMVLYLPLFYVDNSDNLLRCMRSAITDLLRNSAYFYHLWYIHVLIVVYLLAPYLNVLVSNLSRTRLRDLILVLYCVTSVIPSLVHATGTRSYDAGLLSSRLGLFILLYLVGAYVRKHVSIDGGAPRLFVRFGLSDLLVVALSYVYNSRYSPLIFFARLRGSEMKYPLGGFSGAFYEFNNFLVIIAAVLMLLAFLRLNVFSVWINRLGSLSYGAYVVHVFWITILARFIDPAAASEGPHYPVVAGLLILCVIVCSLATEGLRQMAVRGPKSF